MHLIFPALTRLIGYFPWRRISGAEDLPYGVALEWARWCRSPSYLLGDPTLRSVTNFPRFRAPILAYSFSDDVWGSAQSVDWMMAKYIHSRVTRRHIAPADIGVPAIGHFGFFKPSAQPLWEETADWLVSHSTVSSSADDADFAVPGSPGSLVLSSYSGMPLRGVE
jgi:predicted alpha/beta hydrolase